MFLIEIIGIMIGLIFLSVPIIARIYNASRDLDDKTTDWFYAIENIGSDKEEKPNSKTYIINSKSIYWNNPSEGTTRIENYLYSAESVANNNGFKPIFAFNQDDSGQLASITVIATESVHNDIRRTFVGEGNKLLLTYYNSSKEELRNVKKNNPDMESLNKKKTKKERKPFPVKYIASMVIGTAIIGFVIYSIIMAQYLE